MMKLWIGSLLGTLAIALHAGPAPAQSFHGSFDSLTGDAHILRAAATSDQVKAKAVILDKRRRGSLMDVEIRVEFDGVPKGKDYQFYILDAGMKRDGLPPAPVPNPSQRFSPDSNGHLEFGFVLNGFSRGEWMQCTLRSSDRSIQKTIRFIPFK